MLILDNIYKLNQDYRTMTANHVSQDSLIPVARTGDILDTNEQQRFREALDRSSADDITQYAIRAVTGQIRFPGAQISGLNITEVKKTSAVVRYALYVILVSSLYYEHKDGIISSRDAKVRARELYEIFSQAQARRTPYSNYFRDQIEQHKIKNIPSDLENLLKNPHVLLHFPEIS